MSEMHAHEPEGVSPPNTRLRAQGFSWVQFSAQPLAVGLLASVTTLTGMAMAAIAAWDRGGTLVDRVLIAAVATMICAATHLLPALSRRPVAWLLWFACFLGTVYGHLTFFTFASQRAGDVRALVSAQASDVERQADAARKAWAGIRARSVATVARELSWTTSDRRRAALEAELEEAKRAAHLQDQIVGATAAEVTAKAESRADPVAARLAVVTGSSGASVSLIVGIFFAILLELTGAFLWFEAIGAQYARVREKMCDQYARAKEQDGAPSTSDRSHAHAGEDEAEDPMRRLRNAVESGQCKPTVASIRVFMACSQDRALELRRALEEPIRRVAGNGES